MNGVAQRRGRRLPRRRTGRSSSTRELRQEGKLGFWRWASIVFGAAGTYRQNDVVDVIYERGGRRAVASGLPVSEPVLVSAAGVELLCELARRALLSITHQPSFARDSLDLEAGCARATDQEAVAVLAHRS